MKTFLASFFSLVLFGSFAQQASGYTMFWNNYSVQNPAATGLFNKHYAAVNGRLQWLGFNGAPKTANAIYDLRIDSLRSSIGVNYEIDQYGLFQNQNVRLNYAYCIPFTVKSNLSIGTALCFQNVKFTPSDPNTTIPGPYSGNVIDLNLGLMFRTTKLLFGISSYQLLESEAKIENGDNLGQYYKNARHLFITGAYTLKLSNNLDISPSFNFMSVNSPFQTTTIEVNLKATYKKQFWFASSYRFNTSMAGIMTGVDIKQKYRISYAYIHDFSPFGDYSNGSHEVGIALMID